MTTYVIKRKHSNILKAQNQESKKCTKSRKQKNQKNDRKAKRKRKDSETVDYHGAINALTEKKEGFRYS